MIVERTQEGKAPKLIAKSKVLKKDVFLATPDCHRLRGNDRTTFNYRTYFNFGRT